MVHAAVDTYARNHVLTVVTSQHHEMLHEGKFWQVSGQTTLGSGASYDLLIQVGSIPLHLHKDTIASLSLDLLLYEGTTFSAAGTAVTPVNPRRVAHSITHVSTWTHTPTVTDVGTLLYTRSLAVDRQAGDAAGIGHEFILAANTDYLLRATSNAVNNDVGWNHIFSEQVLDS